MKELHPAPFAAELHPLFVSLGVPTLTNHYHVILATTLTCNVIFQISRTISPYLFPKSFARMKGYQKTSFHIHVVSFLHAAILCTFSFPLFWNETLMADHVFGYDPNATDIHSLATGYFLWDAFTALKYHKDQGIGMVMHGVCAFTVFILSYRPFINYYGAVFIMFELSTIFLNINWFMDKLGYTGSKAQLINGIILLSAFFGVRVIFGTYMSYWTFVDIFAAKHLVPTWLTSIYLAANTVHNILNYYWFYLMIKMLAKRFPKKLPAKVNSTQAVCNGELVEETIEGLQVLEAKEKSKDK
ncbi:hypothetical protein BZG36_04399 [Bifiguratus adelaidae]|uniref:TLC domain-containing protein n=1 Tax=Bifiguratus adelaidae TaxID=1938954 RepID=A0A261XVT4_9FUNG|nr:hypothetical protein BZG36_04399 [Bifiguratus adelaidae]